MRAFLGNVALSHVVEDYLQMGRFFRTCHTEIQIVNLL